MSKNHFWISGSWVCLLFLLMSSFVVSMYNVSLFKWLNSLNSNLTDVFWISMTTFGDGLLLGIVLGMFIVVNPRVTFFGLILLLLSSVVVNTIKTAIPSLRPVAELADVHVVGPILRSGSFPSGHSAAAFAVGISLGHFSSSRSLKAFLLLFGLLVGLSRIFVGAHFPTDVLWGIIVSLAIYELMCKLVWPIIEVYVPALPKLDNFFFKVFSLVEVAICLFCLFIYSQAFAEYPPVAIAISTGVLTFFTAAYIKLVRSN